MRAELGRRLTENSLEGAIELGQRLETNVISNLADPPIRIQELSSRVLEPDARDVVGVFQAGALVENFAEMDHARSRRLGYVRQRLFLGLVLLDVFPRV